MFNRQVNIEALDKLLGLFEDQKDLQNILNTCDFESDGVAQAFREGHNLDSMEPIKWFVTGRTGAGKTTLANKLFRGHADRVGEGRDNCTDKVTYYKMGANLEYYDLPGAGGDVIGIDNNSVQFENINRAALGIEQQEDSDLGIQPVTTISLSNRTYCEEASDEPIVGSWSVDAWQHPESTHKPDVIIYMIDPVKGLAQSDIKYLLALLRSQRAANSKNILIFVLNIFENVLVDSNLLENRIEDTKQKIDRNFKRIRDNASPLIVEIDAAEGKNLQELVRVACTVLPPGKMEDFAAILNDKLRESARSKRNHYFQDKIIRIASRISRLQVDKMVGDENILSVVIKAIIVFGIGTFIGVSELREDINNLIDDGLVKLSGGVDRIHQERREDVRETRDIIELEDITVEKPVIEVKDKIRRRGIYEDKPIYKDRRVPVKRSKKVKKALLTRLALGSLEKFIYLGSSPAAVVMAFTDPDKLKQEYNDIHKQFDEWAYETIDEVEYKIEKYISGYEKVLADTVEEVIGQEEVVTGMIEEVVGQRDKVVGREEIVIGQTALQGGYLVIELLLGLSFGIQNYFYNEGVPENLSSEITAIHSSGREFVAAKLASEKTRISNFVESGEKEAEKQIISLLRALLFEE